LAGEDLHFIGKVLDVREPSEAEVKAFMGGGGCNCGSGGCGDGGCEDDNCGKEGACGSGSCGCGN